MLTRQEKAYIRDLLGVPMGGALLGHNYAGFRYFGQAGELEIYMNGLAVEEEAVITGRPSSYFTLTMAAGASAGQDLDVFIDGTKVTYTTQSRDFASSFPRQAIVAGLVNALQGSGLLYQVGSADLAPGSGSNPNLAPVFAELYMSALKAFSVSLDFSQGSGSGVFLSLVQNGDYQPDPSLDIQAADGGVSTIHGYLPICLQLRNDIANARTRLSVSSAGGKDAGGTKMREDELQARIGLFRYYTEALGNALYAGPDPTGRLSRGSSTRIVI